MEEYLHYDNPANGDLHVLVPSKLILCKCPFDVPDDASTGQPRHWADYEGERLFSAAYYAEVLSDFDVTLVIRCGAPTYDDSALDEHGIAVEELRVDEASPHHLLQRIDRFLTLLSLISVEILPDVSMIFVPKSCRNRKISRNAGICENWFFK
jgi:hypothetical protein